MHLFFSKKVITLSKIKLIIRSNKLKKLSVTIYNWKNWKISWNDGSIITKLPCCHFAVLNQFEYKTATVWIYFVCKDRFRCLFSDNLIRCAIFVYVWLNSEFYVICLCFADSTSFSNERAKFIGLSYFLALLFFIILFALTHNFLSLTSHFQKRLVIAQFMKSRAMSFFAIPPSSRELFATKKFGIILTYRSACESLNEELLNFFFASLDLIFVSTRKGARIDVFFCAWHINLCIVRTPFFLCLKTDHSFVSNMIIFLAQKVSLGVRSKTKVTERINTQLIIYACMANYAFFIQLWKFKSNIFWNY